MAVTRLGNANSWAGSSSWPTCNYGDAPGGSDRCLIVGVEIESTNAADVTAISYGGQPATPIIEEAVGSATDQRVELWRVMESGIANQSGGAITGTLSGTILAITVHAQMYEGVDQDVPIPESIGANTANATPNPITTVDVTAGDGSAVASFAGSGNNTTADWATGGSDITERTDTIGNATAAGSYADDVFASGQSVACRCNWANPNRAAQVSIEIQQLQTVYQIQGITRDKNGTVLGNCDVFLCRDNGNNTATFLAHTTSDANNGVYNFEGGYGTANHFVIAWKDDSPHIFDCTDHVLQGNEV
jgi:hypothetical protein